MRDDVNRRCGRLPAEHLIDGGFTKLEVIEDAASRGGTAFAPLQAKEPDPDSWRRRKEGPGVRAWRERMATEAAKTIHAERPATAECVSALARNRGPGA